MSSAARNESGPLARLALCPLVLGSLKAGKRMGEARRLAYGDPKWPTKRVSLGKRDCRGSGPAGNCAFGEHARLFWHVHRDGQTTLCSAIWYSDFGDELGAPLSWPHPQQFISHARLAVRFITSSKPNPGQRPPIMLRWRVIFAVRRFLPAKGS